jgi:hypothetical protein
MKNLMLITVLLVAFSMQSCSQKSDSINVPEKVVSAFNVKFPDAKKVEWEMENDSEWEAEFKWNGKEYSANFSTDGEWHETEYEIKETEIPSNIRAILDQNFSDYEIEEPEVAETPSGKSYEMEIKVGEEEYEVAIDTKGNITKKKESEENDDDDERSESKEKIENNSLENSSLDFTENLQVENCTFVTTGKNLYFILEPGYQMTLIGKDGPDSATLIISVLDETKKVGNVNTRVVEEKEMENGQIVEISRNYFALCKETNSVYYFGEDVDIYKNGKITGHEGAWLAEGENKPGVIMPGLCLLGSRYYQEIAPGIAMDRAEIVSNTEKMETPAGNFSSVLKTKETNKLNSNEEEYKFYALGIGLIKEENLVLIKYGYDRKN